MRSDNHRRLVLVSDSRKVGLLLLLLIGLRGLLPESVLHKSYWSAARLGLLWTTIIRPPASQRAVTVCGLVAAAVFDDFRLQNGVDSGIDYVGG